jgi:hypothetical protein
MTVCPVCEHQQQVGFECDVCGKDLSGPLAGLGPPPVAVERVLGLEQTVPERVGEVGVERFAELEQNRLPKGPDAPPDVTPDLETSRMAPVGNVAVERVADLAIERAADDGVRTAAPTGQVVCRYCKNVQQTGTVCDRCGMKLPVALVTDVSRPAVDLVRCIACGAPGIVGERCKECGRPVTPSEP